MPPEFANVALFPASDPSTLVTGQVIRVDGGMARESKRRFHQVC
ncbi:hypothetical protein [Burkholderia sp. F1]